MMKNTIIAFLGLSFLSCGVTEQETYDRYYILENDTSYDLQIKSYSTFFGGSKYLNTTLTKAEQTTSHIFQKGLLFSNANDTPDVSRAFGDSAVIIFNNKKTLKYKGNWDNIPISFSEPTNRNFFKHFNYENLGNERFLFKITQEDYENAEDCNGNCE